MMDPSTSAQIDAQFEKAVSIVQSLPKTGPIQTGYEEKLAMYSLYKQATVGNVKPPRPGIFDMLGRAKWDAWEKHKDVTPHQAKWQYVETLLKVLQKYSDKTVARNLVQELEAYGDLSGSFAHISRRTRSTASGSSGSASAAEASRTLHRDLNASYPDTSEEDATDDDAGDLTAEGEGGETSEDDRDQHRPLPGAPLQGDPSFRSPSSLSSQMRYRTPIAGSAFSPPPIVPATQPLPGFSTPSAFGGTISSPTMPSPSSASTFPATGSYPMANTTYPAHLAHSSGPAPRSPLPQSQSLNAIPQRNHPLQPLYQNNVDPRAPLERAVEGVQAHIAALTERVEMLEALTRRRPHPGLSSSSLLPVGSSRSHSLLGLPDRPWDPAQMGLWSLVMAPLTRIVDSLRALAMFIAYVPAEEPRFYADQRRRPSPSPVLLVVRRLILDASFVLAVLGLMRWTWRKTGLRRREVYAALGVLWRALVGSEAAPRKDRVMVNRGV